MGCADWQFLQNEQEGWEGGGLYQNVDNVEYKLTLDKH